MKGKIELDEKELESFQEECETAFTELFERARKVNEVQYALALSPEFRGMQDAGWVTAHDNQVAINDYWGFIEENIKKINRIHIRNALALYCHCAEAAGLYEVPKNMLRVASGQGYSMWPFLNLVEKHRRTGSLIAPNSTKVIGDLVGHANELGLTSLAGVLAKAFDPEIRNAFAHADYIIWDDGLRIRKRNGGQPRVIPWTQFFTVIQKGTSLFQSVVGAISNGVKAYDPERAIVGKLNSESPEETFYVCSRDGMLRISNVSIDNPKRHR